MISESVASLLSVCEIAIIKAIGEMISTSAGITKLVTPRKVTMVWPWLVMRSMPRNAWVIQITPVRLTRTTANDASVVRNIYLSIDPIVPYSPQLTTERAACNHPEAGSPNGCAAYRPAGLVSHYHPVDPSTKWPRDGTPCPMVNNSPAVAGRPRQAWQRCAGQVIVPHGAASATNDDIPTA